MKYLGLDIGYSAVKIAVLDSNLAIIHAEYALHHGGVAHTLTGMLARLRAHTDVSDMGCGAVTGSGSVFLTDAGAAGRVNEVAALVEGALRLDPDCASIIEIGGQTAKFITGFSQNDKTGVNVSMNSNCSSGTGSFLEEQVSRLGLDIEDYSPVAATATFVPRIAGRCSVFAKTDIIHHQQEGVPVADILSGLAHAVVRNYKSTVMRRLPKAAPILFVGGVSRNSAITRALADLLRLGPDELRVHAHSPVAGAVGAAALSAADGLSLQLTDVDAALSDPSSRHIHLDDGILPPLAGRGDDDAENKHNSQPLPPSRPVTCWLGIDVGSTSTNLVLVDNTDSVIGYRYLRTSGDPVRAVCKGLAELRDRFGGTIRIAGVGTTGSGRYMTGRLVGADVVKDEITAQARAAVALVPDVDTIFEIGGQDSKFIAIENGRVADFQMNKICAAGTGSFIEEQCKKLDVDLKDIGPLALESDAPANLGERCTVFMETSIAAHLARGTKTPDLCAGLCHSIVKNYMNRVVGQKRVGQRILLQGGIAYNQGVVNAFRSATDGDIAVPPFFSVTGALGAALLAREEITEGATRFRGFDPRPEDAAAQRPAPAAAAPSSFNQRVQDFIFSEYDGTLAPSRKTVGIPRALFTFGMFPMFHPFFKELGLNVLLSEPTSEKTIQRAQDYSLDETCYPVKLINGHTAELVEKGVDYLFFPDLYTAYHPSSKTRRDYGCAYMQLAFKIITKAMNLEEKGITLLAPTIAFGLGREFMRTTFLNLGKQLEKTEGETEAAMRKAMEGIQEFQRKIAQRGKDTIAGLDPNKKAFVLISKIYGITDPVLNLGIPDRLAEMGYQTLPFYDMPEVDIFQDHPNMYWPFAQHTLGAAKLTAAHPNLYAVFLTHHGCGPDTVTAHYFRRIMGDKPYLTIEVDEHSSAVGVVTRVEAFVNSLGRHREQDAGPVENYTQMPPEKPVNIIADPPRPPADRLLLPHLYPYSHIACETLRGLGMDASLLHETTAASIDMGRRNAVTNEYYSLVALLGDALHTLRGVPNSGAGYTLLVPQNEGAEADGQYARFLRTKLDENGLNRVALLSPFLEDLPNMGEEHVLTMFLCLLAGDLVLAAPRSERDEMLREILPLARRGHLNPDSLLRLAARVRVPARHNNGSKAVLAVGEPLVLYNDILNDNTFRNMERAGHRVLYAPFSEYLETFWADHARQYGTGDTEETARRLERFHSWKNALAGELAAASPYAADTASLTHRADSALGYYAGAFGRYRAAKAENASMGVQGVVAVSSMYENTGISLGILHNSAQNGTPRLTLTFDGTNNENDRIRTESFLHYI